MEPRDDGSGDQESYGDMRIGDLLDSEYLVDEILIISHVLGKSKAWVLSHLDEEIPNDVEERIIELISLRKSGYPVHYITGKKEFMGMEFQVEEGVFIPRAETETFVEIVLSFIKEKGIKTVAEIGIGSGAIGVSLAKIGGVFVLGTDVSWKAVEVAKRNARRLGVEKMVDFRAGEFLEPFLEELDRIELVVSNPPYIEEDFVVPPEVSFEPSEALFSGKDGMDFIREYFRRYGRRWDVMMEFSGKEHAKGVLKELCPDIEFHTDLDGVERFFFCPSV